MQVSEGIKAFTKAKNIYINEPMYKHTTFKAGGIADYFITPQNVNELSHLVLFCTKNQVPFYIVGNGSNLLVTDKGFRGVMIGLKEMQSVQVTASEVKADCGVTLANLAVKAADAGLSGLEFAHGIPGTVGGAVYMNAGAYDGEIKNVIQSAEILTLNGEVVTYSKENLHLDYRHSVLMDTKGIVCSAVFHLEQKEISTIKEKMDDFKARRKAKQPLEFASAGSTFKRPTGYYAGKLIQDSGLGGYRVGGAQVSEKHCGFVINTGHATSEDVIRLIEEVKEKVYERFHVELEPEVRIIGER